MIKKILAFLTVFSLAAVLSGFGKNDKLASPSNDEFSRLGEQLVESLLRGANWPDKDFKKENCFVNRELPNFNIDDANFTVDYDGDRREQQKIKARFVELVQYEILEQPYASGHPYKFVNDPSKDDDQTFSYRFYLRGKDKAGRVGYVHAAKKGAWKILKSKPQKPFVIKARLLNPSASEAKLLASDPRAVQKVMVGFEKLDGVDSFFAVKAQCAH